MRFVRVCSAALFILMLPWGAPEDWGEGCRGTKTLHIRCMFECAISFAAGNGGEWCLPAKNVAGTYHQRVASSLTVQSVDDFDLTELHCRVMLHVLFSKWAFWGLPFKVNKALRDAPKLPQDLRFKRVFVFWPELIRSYNAKLPWFSRSIPHTLFLEWPALLIWEDLFGPVESGAGRTLALGTFRCF